MVNHLTYISKKFPIWSTKRYFAYKRPDDVTHTRITWQNNLNSRTLQLNVIFHYSNTPSVGKNMWNNLNFSIVNIPYLIWHFFVTAKIDEFLLNTMETYITFIQTVAECFYRYTFFYHIFLFKPQCQSKFVLNVNVKCGVC